MTGIERRRARVHRKKWSLWRLLMLAGLLVLAAAATVTAFNFPYDVDAPLSPDEIARNIAYYKTAYQETAKEQESAQDARYVEIARKAAERFKIEDRVRNFAHAHGLTHKRMLEIGSGRGYLQDVVADYTGLDISPSVKRFYHKPFVLGSATSMPFRDSEFDGGWSIWVLEHVPNPEAALSEIRRVMKNGAVFYLFPAWDCDPWLGRRLHRAAVFRFQLLEQARQGEHPPSRLHLLSSGPPGPCPVPPLSFLCRMERTDPAPVHQARTEL